MRISTAGITVLLLLFTLGPGVGTALQESRKPPSFSSRIDEIVKSAPGYNLKTASPVGDDGEFLRRVMLDLVGYPPNAAETKAFLANSNPNKRVVKIDQLLDHPDCADLWSRMFAEVFFGNYHEVKIDVRPELAADARDRIVKEFIAWFREKLAKDRPYTEIVYEMLDARGKTEIDRALAYKLASYTGDNKNLEFADRVSKHLLGIRLQCARCHTHPFEVWEPNHYYGLAAFNAREKAAGYGGSGAEMDAKDAQQAEVKEADSGELALPRGPKTISKGKAVKMASGGGSAEPEFLDGKKPGKNDLRGTALAQFMTNKETVQLPKALVNRVWGWLFGRGIVQPVDDFNVISVKKSLSPALLDALTREFIAGKHSIKSLLRAICNSNTYQLACANDARIEKENLSYGAIKQLSGEQMLNSIQVATTGKAGRNIDEARQMVASLYPAGAVWCEVTPLPGNTRQALLLRNNGQILGWIRGGGVLSAIASGGGTLEEKVDEMFLAALSRKAGESERKRYAAYLTAHPESQGFEDAYWTLLNTSEFVTRH